MQKARLIGIAYILFCGLLILAASQGWVSANAPVAIFPTPVPKPGDTITLRIAYSSEKERWLKESLDAWLATDPRIDNSPVKVELLSYGSQEMIAAIKAGTLQPAAISPASMIQVSQLNASFGDVATDAQSLVYTPLVVVAWDESTTATTILKSNDSQLWSALQTQVKAGQRSFLFGQTKPDESNSGLQSFVLMAYAFHGKQSGLTVADIQNPAFQEWLRDYSLNVERFGASSGTFMDDMIRFGPTRYTAITMYESMVLDRMGPSAERYGKLRLIYPPANLWSDHPFAILDTQWTTPEQREAAAEFRAFLLSPEQQAKAVDYGFRPTNPDVSIEVDGSPFVQYQDHGVQLNPGPLVEAPTPEVIDAIMEYWAKLEPSVRQ